MDSNLGQWRGKLSLIYQFYQAHPFAGYAEVRNKKIEGKGKTESKGKTPRGEMNYFPNFFSRKAMPLNCLQFLSYQLTPSTDRKKVHIHIVLQPSSFIINRISPIQP